MNKLFIFILAVILLGSNSFAQKMNENRMKNREKLEQLEKIKVIEALSLDEETSIRFFSRRNESKKEIQAIEQRSENIISELENSIKSVDKNKNDKQKALVAELLKNRESIEFKRSQFINSLNDILTTEQISKYVIFEKKFRDEVRDLLFERRKQD